MTRRTLRTSLLVLLLLFSVVPVARARQISGQDRDLAESMLKDIAKDVQKHYYDPSFHGVNWEATVAQTMQKIKKSNSMNMDLAHIAQALATLNDSHTFFLPPAHSYTVHYGIQYQMIGDRCFIVRVRPGSDAGAKGVKTGDELLTLEGFPPERDDLWKMKYRYDLLRPEPKLRLVIRTPQGQQRQVDVVPEVKQLQRIQDITGDHIWDFIREAESEERRQRARSAVVGDDVMILKIPRFDFTVSQVEGMIHDARKHAGLIVDLRGDAGGDVETLKYLLGGLFDKEVKIADRVGRKKFEPEVAKPLGKSTFAGKLVVLVDSDSASAAELFARVVQLQKRGVVIGDRTSGSVMEAKHFSYFLGMDVRVYFGASITESDLIMSDGKSLEHTGVTPDEVVLPTAADLAAGRDPVLAKAAAMLGANLTPEDAGKMFPYEWPKD